MNRLWVRFSLLIGGVLFGVFFMQFLAIVVPHAAGWEPPHAGPPDAEIARRLLDFMALSAVVGLAGGVLIARVVSAPVSAMARAAREIGQGDKAICAAHGGGVQATSAGKDRGSAFTVTLPVEASAKAGQGSTVSVP